jgi:hypothetical protein
MYKYKYQHILITEGLGVNRGKRYEMNKISIIGSLAILILSICLLVGPGSAKVYGGVDFRGGASSFADEVVSYNPTNGVSGHASNPSMALGKPDYATHNTNYVSLGDQGTLILKFTDNSLTTSGNNYEDLWIFEVGNIIESTDVYISKDGINWIYVGYTTNSTQGIDIDAYIGPEGVFLGELYSYIKIVDRLPHESDSPSTGADIDAVGAISSKQLKKVPAGADKGAVGVISFELPDTTVPAEVDKDAFGVIRSKLPTVTAFLIIALSIVGLIGMKKGK